MFHPFAKAENLLTHPPPPTSFPPTHSPFTFWLLPYKKKQSLAGVKTYSCRKRVNLENVPKERRDKKLWDTHLQAKVFSRNMEIINLKIVFSFLSIQNIKLYRRGTYYVKNTTYYVKNKDVRVCCPNQLINQSINQSPIPGSFKNPSKATF